MKINELIGYKSNELYKKAKEIFGSDIIDKPVYISLDEWELIMKQYGFKHLGSGNFGSVYERPGYPWVFKIFTYDKAYFNYLTYAMNHQGNPHIPKIKGKYIKINKNTYAVRIEKLTPISDTAFRKISEILNKIDIIIHTDDKSNEDIAFIKNNYDLYELLMILYKTDTFSEYGKDMHSSNIMMRGNTPVLVDPVIGNYENISNS